MTADILLVDDNAIQATTRRSVLLRTGRSVVIAGGASQALSMLDDADLQKSVRLVITDHMMPGMNGPEFVARLQEQLPFVPVIVLTGFPDAEAEYESAKIQFRMKPVPPDQLIELAESLLSRPLVKTA